MPSDQALVRAILLGDQKAAEALLVRHLDVLRRDARRHDWQLPDGTDVEDALQEFFIKVCANNFRALAQWQGLTDPAEPSIAPYFRSILRDLGLQPTIAERSRDMALVRSLVANGYGFSLANVRPRTEMSPDGKPLKFVPLAGPARPLKLGIATIRSSRKSRVLKTFEAYCRAEISSDRVPGVTV